MAQQGTPLILNRPEEKSKSTLICAGFVIFLDVCLLPILTISICCCSYMMSSDPDQYDYKGNEKTGTHPTAGYLCKCCDDWRISADSAPLYCCSCGNEGNELIFATWSPIGIAVIFSIIGAVTDVIPCLLAFFIFFFKFCIRGERCSSSATDGFSVLGLRFLAWSMWISLGGRVALFLAAVGFFFGRPHLDCRCKDDATYSMQYGSAYDAFTVITYLFPIYFSFVAVLLLSRRILLGLLRNANIEVTEEMTLFRLCYLGPIDPCPEFS
mmetsp:Transcript_32231/g.51691  ORF Transcript_32231/g.51691 Transcript_32231/m.51691 type:complete len:268 (-) Transcript_32231:82-885(-)|eukprot:CAMPEP_0197031740 /NCGR_PEP_ID=MMETSP1384-20130603/10646_1 /TAXON_ID=29189 /ORGANISM="Ammonia sp." /LENGTH=267 /DNA_ID=CAMNT_0042461311 /DNA_START=19 /DNA_END=822 /DNA_ORIENTATION=+